MTRSKDAERLRARAMRKEGWSLRRIASEIGCGLGSISVWVRDIPGPGESTPIPSAARPLPRWPLWIDGVTKECGRCRRLLPSVLFNRSGAGLQAWCRACFAAYHQARRARAQERIVELRSAARSFVLTYLRDRPCSDCGIADIVVLEFDHLRDKRADVSRLMSRGTTIPRLAEEIQKCEVVCANCHRRRTLRRLASIERTSASRRTRLRNEAYVRDVLSGACCVDCGGADPRVLEFHHLGEKTANVSDLCRGERSLTALKEEIAKCEVLCSNCHRRRTAAGRKDYRWVAWDSNPEPTG